MKRKTRQLELNRETLRRLDDSTLHRAVGGFEQISHGPDRQCATSLWSCPGC